MKTKFLRWYETSTVRKVHKWYETSMVRIVYGTKSPSFVPGTYHHSDTDGWGDACLLSIVVANITGWTVVEALCQQWRLIRMEASRNFPDSALATRPLNRSTQYDSNDVDSRKWLWLLQKKSPDPSQPITRVDLMRRPTEGKHTICEIRRARARRI